MRTKQTISIVQYLVPWADLKNILGLSGFLILIDESVDVTFLPPSLKAAHVIGHDYVSM